MAKPFYSMEEVCKLLGKTQTQIRELVQAGALREFRDAGKVFFKAEDVEQLRGGPRPVEPAPSDSGEIILEPVPEPAAEAGDEALPSLAAAAGGTSIIGLEPLPEEEKAAAGTKKSDTAGPAGRVGVFDEDELEIDTDPMAKTQITAPAGGDQMTLESAGSGSGLLDLTRESDDTSLGAELLDEIYPGEEEAAPPRPATRAAPTPRAAEPEPEPVLAAAETGPAVAPVLVQVGDPHEGWCAGLLVGAVIMLAVAAAAVGGTLQGYLPDFARWLANRFWIFLAGSLLVVLVSALVGWFVNRAATPRRS